MKQKQFSIAALALAGVLTLGAAASVQSVSAQLRPDITVVINGVEQKKMTDVSGTQVYPLSYDGTVYLPIRALGDVLSHDAAWNGTTQTITLTLRQPQRTFTNVDAAETSMTALEKEIAALTGAATHELRAAQYAEYAAKLERFDDDLDLVEDQCKRDFRLDLITRAEYTAINARLEKLEVRTKDAYVLLAEKTLDKAPQGAFSDEVSKLAARVETEVKNVYKYKTPQSASSNKQAYRQLDIKLDALDNDIDRLDDQIELAYKKGTLTYEQYRALELSLDRIENQLDAAQDHLEDVLGYDDDRDDDRYDDDHDDDRDDDHDDDRDDDRYDD